MPARLGGRFELLPVAGQQLLVVAHEFPGAGVVEGHLVAVVAVHHLRQLAGGADPGQVGRGLVDQAAIAAALEGPGQRVALGHVERDAELRVIALVDREEVRVHERVVGIAPGDPVQQLAGVGRRVFGPREVGNLAPRGRQGLHVAGLGHHLDALAHQVGGGAGRLAAPVVDEALADLLVGRAEVHALGALGRHGEAGRGQMGLAGLDLREQIAEAVRLDQLQLHAQVVGEAADEVVVRAFGPGLADEIGNRAVAGDDPQFTRAPGLPPGGWAGPRRWSAGRTAG